MPGPLVRDADTFFQAGADVFGGTPQTTSGTLVDGQVLFLTNSYVTTVSFSDPESHTVALAAVSSDPTVLVEVRGGNTVHVTPTPGTGYIGTPVITLVAQEQLSGFGIGGGRSDRETFFVAIRQGMISGTVYNDVNGNGSFNAGEGRPGVTVFDDVNNNGVLNPTTEPYTVTDASGYYVLTGLGAGTHRVREVVPSDWVNQTALPQTVALTAGQHQTNLNLGNRQIVAVTQTTPAAGVPITEGTPVTLTASLPSGGTYTLSWQVVGPISNVQTAGSTYTFTPTDNAVYTVLVTATPAGGGPPTYTATTSFAVGNAPPTLNLTATPLAPIEGTPIQLSSGLSDPGAADTFTFTWTVTSSNGQVIDTTGWGPNPSFTPIDQGTYTVRLTVRDDDGAEVQSGPLTLTVGNVAPQGVSIVAAPGFTVAENTLVTLTADFTDPGQGDALQVVWEIRNALGNVVATGTTATLDFQSPDQGEYAVTLTVTDKDGAAVTVSRTLVYTNAAPVVSFGATPDRTITEAQTLSLDGDILFSDAGTLDTHAFLWEVSRGGTLVYSSSAARLEFDPVASGAFSGQYAVKLTVTDNGGAAGSNQFNLTVTNTQPREVSAGPDATGVEGQAVTLTGSYRDPALPAALEEFTAAWRVLGPGGNEVAVGGGNAITFTPADEGVYLATFTVTNRAGTAVSDSVEVAVSNAAPTITTAPVTVEIDEGQSLNGTGTATDPGTLDGLAVTVIFGDQTVQTTSVVGGGFAYAHSYADSGLFTVRGAVEDGDGGAANQLQATVLVRNVAPTATFEVPTGVLTIGQEATFRFANPTDPSAADVAAGLLYSYDFDGDGVFDVVRSPAPEARFTYAQGGTFHVRGRIEDKDGGSNEYTVSVVVDRPAMTGLNSPTVAENLPAGAVAGLLETADPDGPGAPVYSLVAGAGADDNARFTIVGNELRTVAPFNFESRSTYSVRIRTTDGASVENVFTVSVADANDAPTITSNGGGAGVVP